MDLEVLLDVTLTVPPEQLRWRPSLWMRGLFSLPVEFTPLYESPPRA
jgi:hypothetical protein